MKIPDVAKFLSTFENIDFEKDCMGFVYRHQTLHNSQVLISQEFQDEIDLRQLGTLYFDRLKRNPFFFKEITLGALKINRSEMARGIAKEAERFCHLLWFSKDNACTPAGTLALVANSVNTLQVLEAVTTCQGTCDKVTFNRAELDRLIPLIEPFNNYQITKHHAGVTFQTEMNGLAPTPDSFLDYNESNRISRALHFLSNARMQTALHTKISMMIPIYEALFSSSTSEVSHRVSERAARYIGEDIEEKVVIYDLLASAYTLRSKYFHGAPLDAEDTNVKNRKYNTREKLIDISAALDHYTRKTLVKVLLKDAELFVNNQVYKNYFTKLQFN